LLGIVRDITCNLISIQTYQAASHKDKYTSHAKNRINSTPHCLVRLASIESQINRLTENIYFSQEITLFIH